MKASDIMTRDPFAVAPTDPVQRAAEIMRELKVGAVPVVQAPDSPVLVGIITDRDIAVRCTVRGHSPACLVRDHMTAMPLQTVGPDADLSEVIDRMERMQVRRIPVLTNNGVLLGIIAQADIATVVGPKDPEQVEELLERISRPAAPVAIL